MPRPPGNEQRRPEVGTGAVKIAARDMSILARIHDIERERATWGQAFALGYASGKSVGYKLGRQDEYHGWALIFGLYRQAIARPTMAELKVRRGEATR
jgi:hypothetical protein